LRHAARAARLPCGMASQRQWPAGDEPRGDAAADGHLSGERAQLDRAPRRPLPAHDVSQRPRTHGDVSDLRLISVSVLWACRCVRLVSRWAASAKIPPAAAASAMAL